MSGRSVAAALDRILAASAIPRSITVDHGTEVSPHLASSPPDTMSDGADSRRILTVREGFSCPRSPPFRGSSTDGRVGSAIAIEPASGWHAPCWWSCESRRTRCV
jgi:hypothetical protein